MCFVYAIFVLSLASLVGFSFAAHGGFPREDCVMESVGGIQKLDSLSRFTPSVFLHMCKQGSESE